MAQITQLQLKRYTKNLRALGIAETVLGCVCVAFGAIATIYAAHESRNPQVLLEIEQPKFHDHSASLFDDLIYNEFLRFPVIVTYGEGIWCGIWIVIAGVFGIESGSKRSNPWVINFHLFFSILASVASAILFSANTYFTAISYENSFFSGLMVAVDVSALSAFFLCNLSTVYSCFARSMRGKRICAFCPIQQDDNSVMYVAVAPSTPVVLRDTNYQPTQPIVCCSRTCQGKPCASTTAATNARTKAADARQLEMVEIQPCASNREEFPPAYSQILSE